MATLTKEQRKQLLLANNDIPLFSLSGQTFLAKIVDCYDGDSFKAVFYLGDQLVKFNCRADGYDSPEMRLPKSDPDRKLKKRKALDAKKRFIELCQQDLLVTLVAKDFDKYGRLLVTVYSGEINVNETMIQEGHGYEYFGGTKRK